MELDWSTFLLEMANFLILVWILKHFLYRPVTAAIAARRERVESVLAQAEAARSQAEQARADYEARRRDLDAEQAEARAELERTLAAERERRFQALDDELGRAREKARALAQRERTEIERRSQEAALGLAGRFAARLLGELADADLEARLVDLAIAQLADLSAQQREALAAAVTRDPAPLPVKSAYPLAADKRHALAEALGQATGRAVSCTFSEAPELVAGLEIDAGALVLGANLRDELRFFTEAGQ
jgi:F-type H+-transporting ATPase subunit b